jgi:hypothetical protein
MLKKTDQLFKKCRFKKCRLQICTSRVANLEQPVNYLKSADLKSADYKSALVELQICNSRVTLVQICNHAGADL